MDRAEISIDKGEWVRVFAFRERQETCIHVGQTDDGVLHISAQTDGGEILVVHISSDGAKVIKP